MLEITRELVEHYLRTTGWTLDSQNDPWWLGTDATGNRERGFPARWLDARTLDVDVVVRITGHSDNLASLAFRLGLCAAAESLFEEARKTDAMSSPPDAILSALATEDRAQGKQLLGLAGIDPLAWDSARIR